MSFWDRLNKKESLNTATKNTDSTDNPIQTADDLFEHGNQYLNNDDTQAFNCFLKAAEMGHIKAMRSVGVCFWLAKGTGFDVERAVYWYKKAAEGGNVRAMRDLANFYVAGIVVEKNEEAAKEWLKKAVENGDDKAANTLGDFEQIKGILAERLLKTVQERTAGINAN